MNIDKLSEWEMAEEKDRKEVDKLYAEMNALVDKHIEKVRGLARRNENALDYQTLLYNLKKKYLS
jgi:hypothetical protein